MKKEFLTVLALLLLDICIQAQSTKDRILQIRNDFVEINTDTALKKLSLSDEEFLENIPDGGGELTGYYKNGELVKLTEWIGLSYGNSTREFYFKRGRLFFVFEQFASFIQNEEGLDKSQTKTTFEGRYYIHQGRLIDKKIKGRRTIEDEEPADVVKAFEETLKEYKELLAQKKKNI